MPNFKEFIKGFEEKPEAEQPKEQPKLKENRDQIIEKVNQKMMNANTYGAFGDKENYEKSIAEAEELRKGLAPKAEPKPQEDKTKVTKGIVDFDNKQDFLEKNNWAKDFSWQGNDLIDRKTNEKVYTLSKEGEQVPVIADEIIKHKGKQPKEEPLFDEYQLSTKKGIEEAKNFLDAKGVKDPFALNNEQFNELADEAAKKYGISRMLAGEFLVAPYDEEISKPQAQPKQGSFEQTFGGTSEVEDEKETQPDGYYKDDNGEIYMMKGGKDYYPVGEAERQDFFRAFNNQNKEKAKEMANAPETAKSFERIYADLDKGFEETYKRKPTQEEKDAIRDIARLQTALIVMATKK